MFTVPVVRDLVVEDTLMDPAMFRGLAALVLAVLGMQSASM